jgi:predicted lipid carrier protein YhbT
MRFPPDPATLLPVLQAPLRVVLEQAPERVLTRLLAAALTHLLRGQALAGRLPELAGRHVSLLVSDLRRELRFRITPAGLASGWGAAWPENSSCVSGTSAVHGGRDVRIRGSYEDFWRLAMRSEDPDTLFFQRRLTIEGDTETGLMLKNLLDGLEYDWRAHVRAVFGVGLPGAPR